MLFIASYYESRRRLFNDSRPERREKATQVKRVSLKRKLQQRVNNFTVIHVACFCVIYTTALQKAEEGVKKRQREGTLGLHIDYNFMTEESEGEDGTVVQHLLPWRSECKLTVYSARMCRIFQLFIHSSLPPPPTLSLFLSPPLPPFLHSVE